LKDEARTATSFDHVDKPIDFMSTTINRFSGLLLFLSAIIISCAGQTGSKSQLQFRKHILTDEFVSEGVAVGDVNKDGKPDVIAGAFWYEAPNWGEHEIKPGKTFDPGKEYSDSFLNFSLDVNLDGWIDQVFVGFPGTPGYWFENPQNAKGHWKQHYIHESVGIGNESPNFVDVDGDGRSDLLCADTNVKQMVWLRAPTKKGETEWQRFPISTTDAPGTDKFSHGLGLGDINKDGRKDVIIKSGWWEAPEDRTKENWTFHQADFGEDCSHMHILDANQDGLNDVISASAHRFGIWLYEQGKDSNGQATWTKHEIDKSISQTHSSQLIDIDADGDPDFLTGKRFFAHNDTNNDPGTYDPAILGWYEYMPGKTPSWKLVQIDDNSGAGLNFVVEDITGDGLLDVIISNKKGVFVFENQTKKRR
jgi:hypothetical protein